MAGASRAALAAALAIEGHPVHISRVQVPTGDASATARFYRDVLELPVAEAGPVTTVRVGSSTIDFVQGERQRGADHLAVTIPSNQFAAAKRWLAARVPVLRLGDADEFRGGSPWDSESVYFIGPDEIVLELIARHPLQNESDETFTSSDLLEVSEVGLAVPDVGAAVADVREAFGLDTFGWNSDFFAPLGDQHGLLILVEQNRIWFPTRHAHARSGPLSVTITGTPVDGALDSPTGWRVESHR